MLLYDGLQGGLRGCRSSTSNQTCPLRLICGLRCDGIAQVRLRTLYCCTWPAQLVVTLANPGSLQPCSGKERHVMYGARGWRSGILGDAQSRLEDPRNASPWRTIARKKCQRTRTWATGNDEQGLEGHETAVRYHRAIFDEENMPDRREQERNLVRTKERAHRRHIHTILPGSTPVQCCAMSRLPSNPIFRSFTSLP